MKKVLVLIAAVFIAACGAYAGEGAKKGRHITVSASAPLNWEWASQEGVRAETFMNSAGFSVDGLFLFSGPVGALVSMDFFFPLKMQVKTSMGTITAKRGDYGSLWGYGLILGVSAVPVRGRTVTFAISAGLHYMMVSAKASYANSLSYLLGVALAPALHVNLTDALYLKIAADITYDFFSFTLLAAGGGIGSNSGLVSNLSVVPKLGIGFRF